MRERESSKANDVSASAFVDRDDPLRQAVESEYTTLYRHGHKAAQKKARHILRHVIQPAPPRPLIEPIPVSNVETVPDVDEKTPTISVVVSDGANRKLQTDSTSVTVMPTIPIVRELICYVPTVKNVATRGHLIGIPYLGDKFDADDQRLINSISIEPSKQQKLTRKKKLDESSLENLYQSFRSNERWNEYSNEQLIDAILHYHRDTAPRARLLAVANHHDYSFIEKQRRDTNIDQCDSIDADIDELIIKPWCSRFCPRCYTYNCLLHKEGPSYLPLPKQISLSTVYLSEPCSSTCYKHQREPSKRPLSPSLVTTTDDETENVRKRARKSANENESLTSDSDTQEHFPCVDLQKKRLICIENHMMDRSVSPSAISSTSPWTSTDRSLFRLFYFLCDGDLCLLNHFFDQHAHCQDLYQQFILDAKYFSQRLSTTQGQPFAIRHLYRRRMPEGTTRAFLLYMKKTLNRTHANSNRKNSPTTTTTLKPAYQPCSHDGPCSAENADCRCMQMGTFCEKFCNCSIDCPHRFPGCACKGSCLFNNCLCTAEGRECDADLCHNCGASLFLNQSEPCHSNIKQEADFPDERKMLLPLSSFRNVRSRTTSHVPTRQSSLRSCRNVEPTYRVTTSQTRRAQSRASLNSNSSQMAPTITCTNISLQRKVHKQILIAESDVAGYGAFLGSPIAQPGDLIAEYTGEIITEEEADRRGRLYDKRSCSYLFNLDMQHCIDARQFGNKLRFANHSSKCNCVPKIKLVNGDYRIGIYAKEVIFQGDELFFEYMYDAHQRQQFVNNERIDEAEQENLVILARYGENYMLVQPSYD